MTDIDQFSELARAALETLPEQFRAHLRDIAFFIEDDPSDELCDEMGLDADETLLGLYQGIPLGDKSVDMSGVMPDRITLYRLPILDHVEETGEALDHVVRHVVVHEVGHHFGLSDEEMEAIEAASD